MKTILRPAFLALLMLALASGCTARTGGDAGIDAGARGSYGDIQWQVRCQATGTCTETPARSILGFDGENAQTLSCSVVETATDRTLSFETRGSDRGDPFGLALDATFPRTVGAPADCEVSVVEGSDTLVGVCGSEAPSEAQPCQVTDVVFGDDGGGRSLIRGRIYCVGISPTTASAIDRDVTAPGAAGGIEPLVFNFYDCAGFTEY